MSERKEEYLREVRGYSKKEHISKIVDLELVEDAINDLPSPAEIKAALSDEENGVPNPVECTQLFLLLLLIELDTKATAKFLL